MANFPIIKLTELTPLHIGTGKENYDFSAAELQSDTLSSALAALKAQQEDCSSEEIMDFLNSFKISSAFPYWKEFLFLPKIEGKLPVVVKGKEEHEYRKKLKSIKYIDSLLWDKMICGELLEVEESQIQGAFLLSAAALQKSFSSLYKSQVNERVSVPKEGGDTKPFFFEWRYFSKDSGLYCIIEATEPTLQDIYRKFELLGAQGIGTDRNVGGGHFEPQLSTIELNEPKDGNAQLLLSMYIPKKEELGNLVLDKARYSLCLRGGFISGSDQVNFRHLRKKSVYMFGVGSIFLTNNSLEGKIVDLKPEWQGMHPVYRSGRPFGLSVKLRNYEQD